MSIINRLRPTTPDTPSRFSLSDLVHQITYLGNTYPLGLQQTLVGGNTEDPDSSFSSITRAAYQQGGPVFACILARAMLFSEARFQWQAFSNGRPGALFGNESLSLLENPWPNGTTGELLWRAEQDVSLSGNFFVRRHQNRLWRLRPDYVTIVLGSEMSVDEPADAIDARVIGYLWGAPEQQKIRLLPEDVCHWSPIPDPLANYRGMSWITPILREVSADTQAVVHKQNFFDKGATVNLVIMPDATVDYEEFKAFQDDFRDQHEGAANAYKTLFLGGGSTIQAVGSSMKEMDFKAIQGAGETRIAASAGVPPIIAGFSEGLDSATYSNYGQARRKFGDHYARPQWRSFAAAMEKLLRKPDGVNRLWYDDRDIAFLREDQGDEADIRQKEAVTIMTLVNAGFEPDAAVAAATTGNFDLLAGQHTGLTSVQLTPPEDGQSPIDSNGSGGGTGTGGQTGGLEDIDGIDPVSAATLLQKLYLATPNKMVVSTEEARRLARRAGLDLDDQVPDELIPADPSPQPPPEAGDD